MSVYDKNAPQIDHLLVHIAFSPNSDGKKSSMNRFEKISKTSEEAELKYMDGEFQVLRPGDFVRCAVTNTPIPIANLKYWSVSLQEPYASAEISLKRYDEVRRAELSES